MGLPRSELSRRAFLRGLSQGAIMGGGALISGCPRLCNKVHILGSGITGLCAGALLAKRGCEVHVLEAHPELLGGHAAGFQRDGFAFCVGPQYVWNFREDGIGVQVLRELGLDELIPFDSMDPDGFDRFRIGGGDELPIPMGLDRFRDLAMEAFPIDYAGLSLFFSYIADLHAGARVIDRLSLYSLGGLVMGLGIILDAELSPRAKGRFGQCSGWTLGQLFDFCRLSQRVRRFLYGNAGIFAENESTVSCVAYAAATGFYHAGADFPRFGFASLVRGLSDYIVNTGGTVSANKRVTALHRNSCSITRVRCQDGDSYETDLVISTLSPRLTFALVEPPANAQAAYAPSNSGVSAFIGVRGYPGLSEKFTGRTLWWQDGVSEVDFDAPDLTQAPRLLAVGSPSSRGSFNSNPRPGDESLVVFAPGNFAQVAAAYARGVAAHDDLRAQITELLVAQLENQLLPGLRSHMRFLEVHTPYDLFLRTLGESGNIYGRRLTPQSLLTRPYTLNGMSNLHIACASAGMPGIASAFQVATNLTDAL